MAYEQKDNSGTLGTNKRKSKDTHPSHSGQCVIEGKAYWVSAWVKEGPTGKFFSLAFKPKEEKPKVEEEFDSEIPF